MRVQYAIRFEKAAEKFLRKQTPKIQQNLMRAIYKLPDGTDIKRLKGHDLYRMRVGNIRIIYSIQEEIKIINIENIDNRGDVYKRY
ncbi:MAG: type II toxin-antitoxin system RelE/ParE family toxin [Lachnospiraceae bacterium]|nr:type II toxin-antitoxin system RelE/ParE family toxin [Lachnospiraceae bacterium]